MANYLRALRLFSREVRLNLITQASFGFYSARLDCFPDIGYTIVAGG